MENNQDIDVVFFDIGGTLGERHPTTGLLKSFPSSAGLLKAMREVVGLRIGVITTLGPGLTNTEGLALLQGAGLAQFWTRKDSCRTTMLGWPNRTWPFIRWRPNESACPLAAACMSGRTLSKSSGPWRPE